MGVFLCAINDVSLFDRMKEYYSNSSKQAILSEIVYKNIKMINFKRVNNSGIKISKNENHDIILIAGIIGYDTNDTFEINPLKILEFYKKSKNDEAFINCLWGNFILIIYDSDKEKLKVFKDFGNSKNLYFAKYNNSIYLSNSLLTLSRFIPVSINNYGIANFFTHISLFEDISLFNEIKKLLPGFIYIIKNNLSIEKIKYASFPKNEIQNYDITQLALLFKRSLKLISLYSNELSIDFTGGYDSRLVLAVALRIINNFSGSVHGENDEEVLFVKKMAEKLNIKLYTNSIGLNVDNNFKNQLEYFLFLFDGEYSAFDAYKEGSRSVARCQYADNKITGGIGEILRDKWYSNVYTKIRKQRYIKKLLFKQLCGMHFLLQSNILSKNFKNFILKEYSFFIKKRIKTDIEYINSKDISYIYLYTRYLHYIRGWLGTLYNAHNKILKCYSPYLEKEILLKTIPITTKFKKHKKLHIELINYFSKEISNIKMIDGYPCKKRSIKNFFIYFYIDIKLYLTKFFYKMINILFKYEASINHKIDYNYSNWINTLFSDNSFKKEFIQTLEKIKYFNGETIYKLLNKGLQNNLTSNEYRLLSKLISIVYIYKNSNI